MYYSCFGFDEFFLRFRMAKSSIVSVCIVKICLDWMLSFLLPKSVSLFIIYMCVCVCVCGIMIRMFANTPVDQDSITSRVIPQTQKIVLDASLLDTHHYNVRIKDKWSNTEKGVAFHSAPRCSSYWKGRRRVVLDKGGLIYIYIYIYVCVCVCVCRCKFMRVCASERERERGLDH